MGLLVTLMLTNRLPGVAKDDHAVEQLEGDSPNYKQIDGRDPGGVIAQEGLPTLGGRLVMCLATVD